jgi:hypothetical protein
MQRKISVSVKRFGHRYELEYRAGRTPETSEPAAAMKIDGTFFAFITVGYHDPEKWSEVTIELPDDRPALHPADLGMHPSTEDEADFGFLSEAEEYLTALLNRGLAQRLMETSQDPNAPATEEEEDEALSLTPHDRGHRVVEVWHNHGAPEHLLPDLIAIEIYDALEHVGNAVGNLLDGAEDVDRGQCGEFVRTTVTDALRAWKHVGDD